MAIPPLTLILFDVDGTLVDSQGHIMAAMQAAFAAQGLPPPTRAAVLSIVGLSLPQAMARLAPRQAANTQDALVQAYKTAFHDIRAAQTPSPLYAGARAVLDCLAGVDTYLLGIATGKSRRGLDYIIESHGLARYFITTQVADDHPSKPHPSMAWAAMAEAGTERGVMIGDTTFDLNMGRAAGLKTIGVTWGYHPVEALQPLADQMIEHFEDLPDMLNTLWDGA